MDLESFLKQTQDEVRTQIADRMDAADTDFPWPESVFAEVVMQHMAEIGMTFEPEVCHFSAKVGNANVRLSGYAVSEEADQLDLFVSLYSGAEVVENIPDAETKTAAEQCLRFLAKCAEGKLVDGMDESNDAHALAMIIKGSYASLEQIRVYVLTDRVAKAKNFKPRVVNGKTVKLEVMDIERLHRHWSEGKPRDELVVNFHDVSGGLLPCVYVPGEADGYDYALTVIPAEALFHVYEKYGARLLEANVRAFLGVTGKYNKGIRDTIRDDPGRFLAYNNGLVIVTDEANLGTTAEGGPGISWLKGMQIVNGGQTTASIYFTKKRNPQTDLSKVRVPAKIIVLRSQDAADQEALVSSISRFANSQNSVKQSDLSANKPFHVELEKLALSTYIPDGVGRWFYERAAGSYNTLLAREGSTPAKLKRLRESIPVSRRIIKTDLAKFLNAWNCRPDLVSLGAQKNFERFMDSVTAGEDAAERSLPDVQTYKWMIAKAIIFKRTQALVRPMFPAFQGNVGTYLVSLVADRVGARLDLDRVWAAQDVSEWLRQLLRNWAPEVNAVMHRSAAGRMISEWAKKEGCWAAVKEANYAPIDFHIDEVRGSNR